MIRPKPGRSILVHEACQTTRFTKTRLDVTGTTHATGATNTGMIPLQPGLSLSGSCGTSPQRLNRFGISRRNLVSINKMATHYLDAYTIPVRDLQMGRAYVAIKKETPHEYFLFQQASSYELDELDEPVPDGKIGIKYLYSSNDDELIDTIGQLPLTTLEEYNIFSVITKSDHGYTEGNLSWRSKRLTKRPLRYSKRSRSRRGKSRSRRGKSRSRRGKSRSVAKRTTKTKKAKRSRSVSR